MNEIRKRKLESAIRREVAELISRQRTKDDRLGLVSITQVEITADLSEMRVFVSPFASEEENADTWNALVEHGPEFQSRVGRALRLRQTPKLVFALDDRIREGDRILGLMDADRLRGEAQPEPE